MYNFIVWVAVNIEKYGNIKRQSVAEQEVKSNNYWIFKKQLRYDLIRKLIWKKR